MTELQLDTLVIEKITELTSKVKEFAKYQKKANIALNWINDFKLAYAQANRKIANGEMVAVYRINQFHSEMEPEFFTNAIVGDCATSLFISDGFDAIKYQDDAMLFKHISELRYEVFAMKKDGTKSAKHLFLHPHYLTLGKGKYADYFIKQIN